MSSEFLDQVKDQLASRSTRTTLEALQQRGLQKVRVIRSSEILQLIEEAVDRALNERGLVADPDQRDEVLAASQEIFQGMVKEEMAGGEADPTLLEEYRQRQEEMAAQLESLSEELAARDRKTQEAEARAAELNAELQVLHQRQEAANPDALLRRAARPAQRHQQPAGSGGARGRRRPGGEACQPRPRARQGDREDRPQGRNQRRRGGRHRLLGAVRGPGTGAREQPRSGGRRGAQGRGRRRRPGPDAIPPEEVVERDPVEP